MLQAPGVTQSMRHKGQCQVSACQGSLGTILSSISSRRCWAEGLAIQCPRPPRCSGMHAGAPARQATPGCQGWQTCQQCSWPVRNTCTCLPAETTLLGLTSPPSFNNVFLFLLPLGRPRGFLMGRPSGPRGDACLAAAQQARGHVGCALHGQQPSRRGPCTAAHLGPGAEPACLQHSSSWVM